MSLRSGRDQVQLIKTHAEAERSGIYVNKYSHTLKCVPQPDLQVEQPAGRKQGEGRKGQQRTQANMRHGDRQMRKNIFEWVDVMYCKGHRT